MITTDLIKTLLPSLNNGQCLDIIKAKMKFEIDDFNELMLKDSTKISEYQELLQSIQAYEVLIYRFEQYLNHND